MAIRNLSSLFVAFFYGYPVKANSLTGHSIYLLHYLLHVIFLFCLIRYLIFIQSAFHASLYSLTISGSTDVYRPYIQYNTQS